jgi:hypothetical protein
MKITQLIKAAQIQEIIKLTAVANNRVEAETIQ